MALLKVLSLAALIAVALAQSDPCAQYSPCSTCVGHGLCGWCSLPVTYPGNNTPGNQCAGFNPSGPNQFTCNGIFSTGSCNQGYVCNYTDFTCQLGNPGEGVPLIKCEQDCYNHGQVFLCNSTTKKCYEVPPGTPGAQSYGDCMAQCVNPTTQTSSPNPNSPSPSPSLTYDCNTTTGQCYQTTPGHGSSLQQCQAQCQQQTTFWQCNKFLWQCIQAPTGAASKDLCQASCNPPHPTPNPPPQFQGLWRGLFIQNGYKVGEVDFLITLTNFTMVDLTGGSTKVLRGIPLQYNNGQQLQLWVNITSPDSLAGKFLKAYSLTPTPNPGAETNYMTAVWGAPGQDPPPLDTAMAGGNGAFVTYNADCLSQACVFTMPVDSIREFDEHLFHHLHAERRLSKKHKELHLIAKQEKAGLLPRREVNEKLMIVDHCSQYSQNCSYCLSHEFCGWCSQNVTYSDGTQGTQCAGFNSFNNSAPFQCDGRYSTTNCDPGYVCNQFNQTCQPTSPGNGFPLNVCELICKPTPSPTPPPEQYYCNTTDNTCYKCNTKDNACPGGMPLPQCEDACTQHKKGPNAATIGSWRGFQIKQGYKTGEYELVINNVTATFYKAEQQVWQAEADSFGSNLQLFEITSGQWAGKTLSAIIQFSQQSEILSFMTIAFSAPNGAVPQQFDDGMTTAGMDEYIFAMCLGHGCKWDL